MRRIEIDVADVDADYVSQIAYALAFVAKEVAAHGRSPQGHLWVDVPDEADDAALRAKIDRLLARYSKREFGLKSVIHFSRKQDSPLHNAWEGLLDRRWVRPVGQGHVVLRGEAARLFRMVDEVARVHFGGHFGAEEEVYPSTILCETLDRIKHFTSFPEHVDFVSHLQPDVDVLGACSKACAEDGWSPSAAENRLDLPRFAITPSCCYHCYEAMEGWELGEGGRCVTVQSNVHRFEGRNESTMRRMRAFHVRDVVWVGHPDYVKASREEADQMIVDLAERWDLACTVENANDMFFTDDYAVKASFQRQQQAKRELRLNIGSDGDSIAVFSSNFHASTFCKAFDIRMKKRHAVSACVGFGLERWVFALFAQHGLDIGKWPTALREDLERYA